MPCSVSAHPDTPLADVEPAQAVPGILAREARQVVGDDEQLLVQLVEFDGSVCDLADTLAERLQRSLEIGHRLTDLRQQRRELVAAFLVRRVGAQCFQRSMRLVDAIPQFRLRDGGRESGAPRRE